ncbi:HNH endonuclease [Paraburkholderia sp. 5N]|uniref:HNH endonuclease n=1 Tax=Paraburkholderia elongata TaxID=2675747 RepID=A0A972NLG5_9BURK|nr:HNH endonuclease [Paraburkholderia elongata]
MTRRTTIDPLDESLAFYAERYEVSGTWLLVPGKKLPVLGDPTNRHCRFCGERPPVATFRKLAHAIPQSLGNNSLFSAYECDECNALFGRTIENDFANWSMPMRTFARIRGKNGVPTLKSEAAGWRIEYDDDKNSFNIDHREGDPVFAVDPDIKQITLRLKRDPYTPIEVLKAFVKMGLSLMPESEIEYFSECIAWIREADNSNGFIRNLSVIYTVAPGAMPNDKITTRVLRRRAEYSNIPYLYFVLIYGNEMFQVMLPSPTHDQALNELEDETAGWKPTQGRGEPITSKAASDEILKFFLTKVRGR